MKKKEISRFKRAQSPNSYCLAIVKNSEYNQQAVDCAVNASVVTDNASQHSSDCFVWIIVIVKVCGRA